MSVQIAAGKFRAVVVEALLDRQTVFFKHNAGPSCNPTRYLTNSVRSAFNEVFGRLTSGKTVKHVLPDVLLLIKAHLSQLHLVVSENSITLETQVFAGLFGRTLGQRLRGDFRAK